MLDYLINIALFIITRDIFITCPYISIRAVIRRIIKSIRLRGRIYEDILLTALVRRNRYGITKWGVSLNTGILFGALTAHQSKIHES